MRAEISWRPLGDLRRRPADAAIEYRHYERDMFAVLPWAGIRLGAQVTCHLRAYVGYDYMYLSNVARAGEQIDPRVNTTQRPPRTGGGGKTRAKPS